MLGRPPPDNENVFSYVVSTTVDSGSLGILYAMMTVFGLALVMYGIFNLNGLLQEKQKDALLSFGTFLFILGQFGGLIAWSIDPAMIIAKDTANVSNMAIREMSLFFMFGPLGFLGSALVSLVLANRVFVNPLFMKISAVVFYLSSQFLFSQHLIWPIPVPIIVRLPLCHSLQVSVLHKLCHWFGR